MDEGSKRRVQGFRSRRIGTVFVAVAVMLVVSPFLTRLLSSFRGVVLEVRGDEMLVAYPELPPEWRARIPVEPGTLVAKEYWSWHPVPVASTPEDGKLLALYGRWAQAWEGHVVERVAPSPPREPFATIVVQTDAGERRSFSELVGNLEDAVVGQRVVKEAGEWDPRLVTSPAAP